ncbi:MAG: hypothetical protein RBG13Loki_0759 [Promethearchaeota archaeon CR_4]|nr:MAG: hypothetical protein RBG13Loki_0759 [Candidatus Lokiarchaeota archaeon CR_4]
MFALQTFGKFKIPRKLQELVDFYWEVPKNSTRATALEVGKIFQPRITRVETIKNHNFTGDISMAHQTEASLQVKLYEQKIAKEQEYSEKLRTATTPEEKKYFAKKMLQFGFEASQLARRIHSNE